MPNSQIYRVFLIRNDSAPFLFAFKQSPKLRPSVGDVLTNPLTFDQFKILRDETPPSEELQVRFTDGGFQRITDDGFERITDAIGTDPDDVTHNYFVTPANNPNRISSYSTSGFANDQTLKQLFR